MNVGTDLQRAFREVPPWGWGILGIGGLYLVLHHAKSSAAAGSGTMPGPITQASDPLATSDPSGGMSAYIEALNSGYTSQAEIWSNALANLQESNAQLLQQSGTLTGAGGIDPSQDPGRWTTGPIPYDPGPLPPGLIAPTVPAGGSVVPSGVDPVTIGYPFPPPDAAASPSDAGSPYSSTLPAYYGPYVPQSGPAPYSPAATGSGLDGGGPTVPTVDPGTTDTMVGHDPGTKEPVAGAGLGNTYSSLSGALGALGGFPDPITTSRMPVLTEGWAS